MWKTNLTLFKRHFTHELQIKQGVCEHCEQGFWKDVFWCSVTEYDFTKQRKLQERPNKSLLVFLRRPYQLLRRCPEKRQPEACAPCKTPSPPSNHTHGKPGDSLNKSFLCSALMCTSPPRRSRAAPLFCVLLNWAWSWPSHWWTSKGALLQKHSQHFLSSTILPL